MIKSGEVASPFRIASNAPGVSEKKKKTQNVEDARARYSNLRGLELSATAESAHFPRVVCA